MLKSLVALRKEIENLDATMKKQFSKEEDIKHSILLYMQSQQNSLMLTYMKLVKENPEDGLNNISGVLAIHNYLNNAFTSALLETESYKDVADSMASILKSFETKLKEQSKTPNIIT